MPRPLKTATDVTEQITILRDRGMDVDEGLARQWLANVSYYRLSAYWYPGRKFGPKKKRIDSFEPGVSFADVVALYEADRKLRTLVHDGMERVEVALRTRLGELLCLTDPLAYEDPSRFRDSFDHEKWMKNAKSRIGRATTGNEAIRHCQNEYGGRFPFWVLAEVLDFRDVSKMFEGLGAIEQRAIAEHFGFTVDMAALSKNVRAKAKRQSPLVRWLEQLTIIRNICAHHGRLWNRVLVPAPTTALRTIPQLAQLPEGQSGKLFGALLVMSHMMRVTSPGSSWSEKVLSLLGEEFIGNALVARSAIGLPDSPQL